MADTVYQYRTPAEFPDRIQLGDNDGGDFSNQEYDVNQLRHTLELLQDGAVIGTYTFGADGFIRFNGSELQGPSFGNLTEEQLAALLQVSDNIVAVVSVSEHLDAIDAVSAALEDGTFDDLADVTLARDAALAAQVGAEAAEANAQTAVNAALNSAAAAAASATDADAEASSAGASATLASRWAAAPSDSEVEPGLKSARAYAQDAQAFARSIAGIPYREVTGAAATLTKATVGAAGDEFSAILCTGATNKTITLPPDFNITPSFDGRPAFVPIRVMRTGAGTVTLAGSGGSTITPPSVIGEWQGTYATPTTTPPHVTTPLVRSITVPAGLKRYLFVVAGEVNAEIVSHTITLASTSGSITVITADTAPTGNYSITPTQNSKSWIVALADSLSAGTDLDLTFTIPADSTSLTYKVWAAKDVNAITGGTGASISTPSRNHSLSITSPLNGLVMTAFFHKGFVLPVTLTGGISSTAVATGIGSVVDHMIVTGHLANAPAGANAFATTWVESKQGAALGVCFESATTGGSSVAIIGTPLTVGADSSVDIMAASDGRTYYLRHGG